MLLCLAPTVNLKNAQCESCELSFIWGKNEDYSPGDSTSDNSEKLLQRSRGEDHYMCDFGKGEVRAIKHIFFFFFFHKISAIHEEHLSP